MNTFWKGKRVWITGHTGFKGSWLSLMLHEMGARIAGYALDPPTTPNLFYLARIESLMDSQIGDIRDLDTVKHMMNTHQPEVVFHLAAQPLVRDSYTEPVDTFLVNTMGTAHVLEGIRSCQTVKAAVIVTTDKCYEISETVRTFTERDRLGGHDPYSASKACAELVTQSYRQSFFASPTAAAIATARAGNVIGGGDYGKDRLLPDFFRAALDGAKLEIRHPTAVRPWQHVLDALTGYLMLGQALFEKGHAFAEAWNFGPTRVEPVTVREIIRFASAAWNTPVCYEFASTEPVLHESPHLSIDATKARTGLNWVPCWSVEESVRHTVDWHKALAEGREALELCLEQLTTHQEEFHAS